MIKKLLVFISMILIIGSVVISSKPSIASEAPIQPILDVNIDPDLHLSHISHIGREDLAGILYIHEYWVNDKKNGKKSIIINRWIFENSKEIDAFIKDSLGISYRCNFDKWDTITDIGDKTHWMEPGVVIFAKGKTLVKIWARLGDISPDSKKEYTRKIAKSIAKKL